jgi:hypothetical protein
LCGNLKLVPLKDFVETTATNPVVTRREKYSNLKAKVKIVNHVVVVAQGDRVADTGRTRTADDERLSNDASDHRRKYAAECGEFERSRETDGG